MKAGGAGLFSSSSSAAVAWRENPAGLVNPAGFGEVAFFAPPGAAGLPIGAVAVGIEMVEEALGVPGLPAFRGDAPPAVGAAGLSPGVAGLGTAGRAKGTVAVGVAGAAGRSGIPGTTGAWGATPGKTGTLGGDITGAPGTTGGGKTGETPGGGTGTPGRGGMGTEPGAIGAETGADGGVTRGIVAPGGTGTPGAAGGIGIPGAGGGTGMPGAGGGTGRVGAGGIFMVVVKSLTLLGVPSYIAHFWSQSKRKTYRMQYFLVISSENYSDNLLLPLSSAGFYRETIDPNLHVHTVMLEMRTSSLDRRGVTWFPMPIITGLVVLLAEFGRWASSFRRDTQYGCCLS